MKTKESRVKKFFYKTNPRGISLIVLVITIIVIIILATAIIVSLVNNNPISEANRARYQSDRDNMQSIFTNTIAKIMAEKQETISIEAGILNTKTSGVTSTTGDATYKLSDGVTTGKITFDDESSNDENQYYTGKKLPIYKMETVWHVDEEGILRLRVGNMEYTEEGDKESNGTTGGGVLPPLPATVGEIVKTSAKEYTDADGEVATIPIGFAIVPGKDVIKDGLVISDVANDAEDIGNQFVWIPVDDISTFVREPFYAQGNFYDNVDDFEEPYSNACEVERKEYENMMASIEKYHGFYIGRYEISKSEDGSGVAQSKKGKTPWVYISWGNSMTDLSGGIVEKARGMYPYRENLRSGEVVSTLVYGTAWDKAIKFIKTNEKYVNVDKDSTGFGNHNLGKAMPTGSNDEYCLNNIYDMAGNIREYTMEVSKSSGYRVYRGGNFDSNNGIYATISTRVANIATTAIYHHIGGRVQLYIK